MERTADEEFVRFVRTRRPGFLRAAYLVCGDEHLAHDLVQEALIKVASRWHRLREGSPEAYVRRILYRDAISAWRKVRREDVVAEPAEVETGGSVSDPIGSWVAGADVRQALQQLPRASAPCWCCATTKTNPKSRSPECWASARER